MSATETRTAAGGSSLREQTVLRRAIIGAALGLAAGLLAAALWGLWDASRRALTRIENVLVDARFLELGKPDRTSDQIRVVVIDDESIAYLSSVGVDWPF